MVKLKEDTNISAGNLGSRMKQTSVWLTQCAVIVCEDQLVILALPSLPSDGHVCDLQFNQESSGHRYFPGGVQLGRIRTWVT